jgi:hypothetical protein
MTKTVVGVELRYDIIIGFVMKFGQTEEKGQLTHRIPRHN